MGPGKLNLSPRHTAQSFESYPHILSDPLFFLYLENTLDHSRSAVSRGPSQPLPTLSLLSSDLSTTMRGAAPAVPGARSSRQVRCCCCPTLRSFHACMFCPWQQHRQHDGLQRGYCTTMLQSCRPQHSLKLLVELSGHTCIASHNRCRPQRAHTCMTAHTRTSQWSGCLLPRPQPYCTFLTNHTTTLPLPSLPSSWSCHASAGSPPPPAAGSQVCGLQDVAAAAGGLDSMQ